MTNLRGEVGGRGAWTMAGNKPTGREVCVCVGGGTWTMADDNGGGGGGTWTMAVDKPTGREVCVCVCVCVWGGGLPGQRQVTQPLGETLM